MEEALAFLAVSALVIVTPGQDTALTIRSTLLGGRRGGILTALGVSTGQAVWTVAASAGVTAVLLASETAFLAVRLAGAAYLVFLGAQLLLRAVRGRDAAQLDVGAGGLTAAKAYRQGVISNLGNPKMAVFFTSLLPQFAPAGDPRFAGFLALGVVFCVMTACWLTLYALVVSRARSVFERSGLRRTIESLAGATLVALGVRLAAER